MNLLKKSMKSIRTNKREGQAPRGVRQSPVALPARPNQPPDQGSERESDPGYRGGTSCNRAGDRLGRCGAIRQSPLSPRARLAMLRERRTGRIATRYADGSHPGKYAPDNRANS